MERGRVVRKHDYAAPLVVPFTVRTRFVARQRNQATGKSHYLETARIETTFFRPFATRVSCSSSNAREFSETEKQILFSEKPVAILRTDRSFG